MFLRLVLRILMAGIAGGIAFFALFIPTIIIGTGSIATILAGVPLGLIGAIVVGTFSLRTMRSHVNASK